MKDGSVSLRHYSVTSLADRLESRFWYRWMT